MATLFISDLHLSGERPRIAEQFIGFLEGPAREADAVYILGDLFEAWLGDDLPLPEHRPSLEAMRGLAAAGVPLYFMQGNRDFLTGGEFERLSGARLLPDPSLIDLYGEPTLLLHGDTLCTDDVEYQRFRQMVRDPAWQKDFLGKPAEARIAMARELREVSRKETGRKAEAIMDVNAQAVAQAFREHGVRRIIHGHTHRPAVHDLQVDGAPVQRIVLGDWYEQGSVLRCDAQGCSLAGI